MSEGTKAGDETRDDSIMNHNPSHFSPLTSHLAERTRSVFYIAGKELLLRWRDRLGFFWWMIGFPLLISVLIGTIFSGMLGGPVRKTQVAWVDLSGGEAGREYATVLERTGNIETTPMSEAVAQEAVRRGEILAYVRIEPDFHLTPAIFFGKPLPLSAAYDVARKPEWIYLEANLTHAAAEYLRERWIDPQRRPALIRGWLADMGQSPAFIPLATATIEGALATMDRYLGITSVRRMTDSQPASAPEATDRSGTGADRAQGSQFAPVRILPLPGGAIRPKTSFEICFPIGIIWGLLGLCAEFAIAFVMERQAGTLLRLRVAPFSRAHMLAGNGLACFVSCIGVMVMLLAVGYFGFHVRIQSIAVLAMAMFCIALCSVGLTMLLAVIGKTESAVGGGAWAILLILALLGGGMVPQMFMPEWMALASNLSPVKWAIVALEGGIWRNFSPVDVLRPCAILLAQAFILAAAGVTILNRIET